MIDSLVHNVEVKRATTYLLKTQITKLSWHICSITQSAPIQKIAKHFETAKKGITQLIHPLLSKPIEGEKLFADIASSVGVKAGDIPRWAIRRLFYPPGWIKKNRISTRIPSIWYAVTTSCISKFTYLGTSRKKKGYFRDDSTCGESFVKTTTS